MRNRISGGRTGKAVLFLALLLGLISAVLVYVYLSEAGGEKTAASGETKPVVVAKEDIPVATRITDDMVEIREISVDAVHPDSFSTTEGVVGNLARYPITAGEQILSDRVAASSLTLPEGKELPLPYIVPEGKRAVSVAVSGLVSAGGLVRPGDYVDVILTVKLGGGDQIGRVILQNLEVLALDQQLEKVAPNLEGGDEERVSTGEAETNPDAETVTLAVTSAEGEVLVTAEECANNFGGRLALALRPYGEHTTVGTGPTWSETGTPPFCSQLFGLGLPDLKETEGAAQASGQP
jgi:pilus assembly protein CpaB